MGPAQNAGDPIRSRVHLAKVVAEHLDGDVPADARDQLVETHLDGLRDLVRVTRKGGETLFQALHQLFLGEAGVRPFRLRFQDDEGVRGVRRHRIRRDLGRARARECEANLRRLGQCLLDLELHGLALIDRRAWDAHGLHEDVALIELW